MNRPRVFVSRFLIAASLFLASADRAQQSSGGTKPQVPPAAASTQQAAPQPQGSPAPPASSQATQQSSQTFTREVTLVDGLFTVLNRRNKLVPDLDQADFKVFDEGKPQEIRFFSRQTDLPLRIGMLVDTSNSIRDRLKFEQDASVSFLFSVLRRNKDQAFVMTFDDEPQILSPSPAILARCATKSPARAPAAARLSTTPSTKLAPRN